jgi:membrane associated rhomboid family serine protease
MLDHPVRLIWIAIGLMVFGVAAPFLMVIKVIESTMFLNFAAFIAQAFGFILGFVALALYRGKQKNKRDDDDWREK